MFLSLSLIKSDVDREGKCDASPANVHVGEAEHRDALLRSAAAATVGIVEQLDLLC